MSPSSYGGATHVSDTVYGPMLLQKFVAKFLHFPSVFIAKQFSNTLCVFIRHQNFGNFIDKQTTSIYTSHSAYF